MSAPAGSRTRTIVAYPGKANTNIKTQTNSKAFGRFRNNRIVSAGRSFPHFAAKVAKNLPRISLSLCSGPIQRGPGDDSE
jgi:hypothetical protein